MRYLIKYTKEADIKFISHLDLLRTIQRSIRRSGLPIHYSKGFNPHMATAIAQPLSVGVYSDGEYMDAEFDEEVEISEMLQKLNENSARGVRFLNAVLIPEPNHNEKKFPQAMALIDGARYIIKIKYSSLDNFEKEMETLMNKEEWIMVKRSKRAEKEVNIRPMVKEIKYWTKDDSAIFNILISAGSREHLSADLFVDLIKKNTTNVLEDEFVDIKREEMYFLKEGNLVPLCECI
ncbi:radical SAM-linked protein [Clostridium thermobutyricum]|uniref:Radical SAM-linked protein n=1 Tax=Clostridium thermobutyricum TaxID=29372 RepID=N9WE22_9CLOT|nr:TIGR03936 family radical SAM-associated protein [Clostridium thermobutyricum]ENZ01286.1 radical SAM-linked protein [Clostridium thermobutyricum]